jgi:RND superfamily putative drug exporter
MVSIGMISSATNALTQGFSLPGKPGFEANRAILHEYGNGGENPPVVPVITLPTGTTVDRSGVMTQLATILSCVRQRVPHVRIVSYVSTRNRLFVSADGRTTFALIFLPPEPGTGFSQTAGDAVQHALESASIDGARFQVTGLDRLAYDGPGSGPSTLVETLAGGVAALAILALVFRSLLALIPLLTAVVAIPTAFLLVWVLTHVTTIAFTAEFLIAVIGLGVSIDYSLLIVLRWREERDRGLDNRAAVQRAMETAGVSVVFSGSTVAISLLSLVVLPVPVLRSAGYASMLIPLVSVLVAITLVPVILASFGSRVDWPYRTRSQGSRFWTAWGRLTVRRRWVAAALATAVLGALTIPAFSIQIGDPQANALAQSGDAYAGLRALEEHGIGPGVLNPFEVLVRGANPNAVASELARIKGVRGTFAPTGSDWRIGATALVAALPQADGSSTAGQKTLSRVRQAAKAMPGTVQVGGSAALNADLLSAIYDNFPLMLTLVAMITLVLLIRAFRSLLLALKAVVLVLISLGASLGLMTLVWQEGHGSQAIWGIPATGAITSYVPLLLFAFLFGISMDYEVFLLSRMREEYDASGSTNVAVVHGIGNTGRLVTSAALILFFAFASLASAPIVEVKIFATGLAAGIILDATVIRMLLVPSVVSLLGRWNWWLPNPLAKLLRVAPSHALIEPHSSSALDRTA